MSRRTEDKPGGGTEASRALGVGMMVALSTALFLWLGSQADSRLETEPIFTLLGALIGAAAGFYSMYHHLVTVPAQKRRREEDESRGEAQE